MWAEKKKIIFLVLLVFGMFFLDQFTISGRVQSDRERLHHERNCQSSKWEEGINLTFF